MRLLRHHAIGEVAEEEALRVSQEEVELISSSAPIVIDDQANTFKMPAVMEVVPRDTLSVKELITLTDAGLLSYWYEEFCSGSSKTTEIMDEAWRCYTAFNQGLVKDYPTIPMGLGVWGAALSQESVSAAGAELLLIKGAHPSAFGARDLVIGATFIK